MRQTIRAPIAQDVYARAKQADDQFLRSNSINGQNVTFVNDERNERLRRILDKISEGNHHTCQPQKRELHLLCTFRDFRYQLELSEFLLAGLLRRCLEVHQL